MKISTKIKERISIILGCIICCLLFWNRFIRIRSPYFLQDIEFTFIKYFFISLSILILSLVLITNTLIILDLFPKINIDENSKFYKVNQYLRDAPKNFFEFLYDRYSFRFLETPMAHVGLHCSNSKGILFFTILILLPPVILSIIFFIEVVYFNNIYYFIKALYLLTLPLMLRSILYISYEHTGSGLEYVKSFLEFYRYKGYTQPYVRIKPELHSVVPKINLDLTYNWYLVYSNIRNFCESIYEKIQELRPYFMVTYSTFFLTAWLYILIYSLIA